MSFFNFNPMDLNNDGQVNFTDYMIFNTQIASSGSDEDEEYDNDFVEDDQ